MLNELASQFSEKPNIKPYLWAVVGGVIGAAAWEAYDLYQEHLAAREITQTGYTIKVPGLKERSAGILIPDLHPHTQPFVDQLADSLHKTTKILDSQNIPVENRVVFVPGDFTTEFDDSNEHFDLVHKSIYHVASLGYPTFGVEGNHDRCYPRNAQLRQLIDGFGFRVPKIDEQFGNDLLFDHFNLWQIPDATDHASQAVDSIKLLQQKANEGNNKPFIIFAHNPTVYDLLSKCKFPQGSVVLSGHVHGLAYPGLSFMQQCMSTVASIELVKGREYNGKNLQQRAELMHQYKGGIYQLNPNLTGIVSFGVGKHWRTPFFTARNEIVNVKFEPSSN